IDVERKQSTDACIYNRGRVVRPGEALPVAICVSDGGKKASIVNSAETLSGCASAGGTAHAIGATLPAITPPSGGSTADDFAGQTTESPDKKCRGDLDANSSECGLKLDCKNGIDPDNCGI